MARIFEARPDNDLPDTPNYNVCPTNRIHAVTSGDGVRRLSALRWGFLPHWYKSLDDGPLLINARGESIAEKPAFRAAARHRRCLVPATGFYEWVKAEDGARDPYNIFRADGAPLAFAAIWQDWQDPEGDTLRSCAIVTTAANAAMRKIHHRMPVIVEPEDWPLWLGEAGHGAARLLHAPENDLLRFHRVSRAVNSNRASGPELVDPA